MRCILYTVVGFKGNYWVWAASKVSAGGAVHKCTMPGHGKEYYWGWQLSGMAEAGMATDLGKRVTKTLGEGSSKLSQLLRGLQTDAVHCPRIASLSCPVVDPTNHEHNRKKLRNGIITPQPHQTG